MAQLVTVKITPPFRSLVGRFVTADKDLLEGKRDMVRRQGRRYVGIAREEAPKGKTGKFAAGIRFRTFVKGTTVGFSVTSPQPLGTFIIRGTRPHKIVAKGGGLLSFPWAKGPAGPGQYFFKSVNHPGTKANRFHGRAFRRWIPGARADLKLLAGRYVRTLAG